MRKNIFGISLSLLLAVTACDNSTASSGQAEGIKIDVERFQVELAEDDYALGGEQPLVTVVIFSDYACGPCGVLWQVMKHLEEDYGEDIRIVHRGVRDATTVP